MATRLKTGCHSFFFFTDMHISVLYTYIHPYTHMYNTYTPTDIHVCVHVMCRCNCELKRLKVDLLEMKKQSVKMLNQMRTEATTKKLEDQRKSKEIAQLKKDSQKKECRIKSLETDAKRREFVLKRRQEEVWLHGWGVCVGLRRFG